MNALLIILALQAPGPRYEWPTELIGGAVADMVARGPWMAESVRRSPAKRVAFATALSVAYEGIEAWNGQANALRWEDVAMRFVGTLAFEGLVSLFRRER